MQTGSHKPGNVRHVYHHHGPDLICYGLNPLEVDQPRVGAGTGHYQTRTVLSGQFSQPVAVENLGAWTDTVRDKPVVAA